MGHCKVICQMAQKGQTQIAETLIHLINTSIHSSNPLNRLQQCSQIMLDKVKGNSIDKLRIIQLCKADLNFVLHVLWGKQLIHHAMKHNKVNKCQYALPGSTCQSAVWSKILFCDLLHQTKTKGIMTDYDATAALDRVLHAITLITCHRLEDAQRFMQIYLQSIAQYGVQCNNRILCITPIISQ
jgi:hypothetical protein